MFWTCPQGKAARWLADRDYDSPTTANECVALIRLDLALDETYLTGELRTEQSCQKSAVVSQPSGRGMHPRRMRRTWKGNYPGAAGGPSAVLSPQSCRTHVVSKPFCGNALTLKRTQKCLCQKLSRQGTSRRLLGSPSSPSSACLIGGAHGTKTREKLQTSRYRGFSGIANAGDLMLNGSFLILCRTLRRRPKESRSRTRLPVS